MTGSGSEAYVREHIVEYVEEYFPDNSGLEWIVHHVTTHPLGLIVELEPRQGGVGYERLRFLFFTNSHPPVHLATYCLDEGRFVLLSTHPRAPSNLPKVLV